MDNKKRILISIGVAILLTWLLGYFIFQLPDLVFPLNFKIIITIIIFISLALSTFQLFVQTNILREQVIDDKKKGLRRSNFLIAFVFVTVIWGISFVLLVYNSPNNLIFYLFRYGPYLPLGILGWYVIVSLIRKERYLTKHEPITAEETINKNEPTTVAQENIAGIIITEGGYPAHGYDLIFTEKRLIVVDAGPTIGSFHVSKGDKKSLQYQGLSPEQILSNTNCKWAYYHDIAEAKLNKGLISSFLIKAPAFSGKYYFKRYQYQQAENLFNKFLYLKSSSGSGSL